MIKMRKVLSLILVGVIAVTSLVCGSVTAGAVGRLYGNGNITGKYVNDDSYNIIVQYGEISFSEEEYIAAYDEVKNFKAQAVADIMFGSDGETCYGFLGLDYVYPMENPFNKSVSGQTSKDRITRRFIVPFEMPESKLEGKLSLSSFSAYENMEDILTSINFKYTNTKDGSGLDVFQTGFTCTIKLNTDSGAAFLNNLQNCKKWYFTTLKLKDRNFFSLSGDAPEFFDVKKFSLEKDGYKEAGLVDHSKISVTALKIGAIADQTYTGKEITPDVKLSVNTDYTLKKDKDYTLTYKNNKNIGKASVTIKMIGDYTGSKTLTFNINPKTTALKASKTSSKFKLSWNKLDGIDGYQIQYSTDGGYSFKNAGKFSASKKSCSLALDTNKKQIFRIRTYKVVNGVTYYSKWSKTVTVKK